MRRNVEIEAYGEYRYGDSDGRKFVRMAVSQDTGGYDPKHTLRVTIYSENYDELAEVLIEVDDELKDNLESIVNAL